MRQIDGPTAVNPKPVPAPINGPGWFNHANPRQGGGVPTIVTSDFLNALQDEIINLLAYVGFTPDWTDNSQVLEAILALIKAGGGGGQVSSGTTIFFAADDIGATNSITITVAAITGTPAVGTTVAVYMANNNTGATTINLNGLGRQPVVNLDGSQLFNNQLQPHAVSLFTLHGTGWYLLSPSFWQPPIKVAPTVDGSQNGGSVTLEPFGANAGALILNKAGKLMFSNATGASLTEIDLDLNTGQLNTQMVFCKPLGKYLTPGFNNSFTWVSNVGDLQKVYQFTVPQFTYQVMFQVTGGGGAGGNCDFNHVGSGGGAGETVMQIVACQPGDTAIITVGGQGQLQAGIASGISPTSDNGLGAGYSSSVAITSAGVTTVIKAGGGSGGNSWLANQNQPGGYGSLVGGVTASNAWLVSGGFGADGIWNNGNQIGGQGGGSYWGPGGMAVDHSGYYARQDQANTNFPGPVNLAAQGHGPAYGAGGGGAYNFNGADTGLGGIGGTGIVLALW